MSADASVFNQANKPTTALMDPNTVLMQTAQAAQAVNQNRLFQANQARGQLMQQAIDPSTGQFSPTAFNRLLAQTPAAALAAPEAVGQSQGLMGSQNELATRQNQFMSQSLGAVLAVPDAQLHDAAANAMTRAVSAGLLPPEQAMRQMIMLPNDPTQLRQHLTQVQMSLLPPGAQQEATYGSPSTQNDGQSIQSGTTAPARLGGGFTPNSTTQVYPSRSELAGRTNVGVNSDGSQRTGPLANVTPPNLAGPAGRASPLGTGRLPPALMNPARAQGASATASPAAPNNGEVTTSQGPAQSAALSTTGAASAKAFQDITDQGLAAQGQNATLGNMLSDAQQFDSGMTKANDFRTFVTRQAPAIARAFGMDPDKVVANESFDKLAAQIAGAQGAGSDARLGVAQAGNPSSHLSGPGVDQIVRQLQGNADYNVARSKLAAGYPDKADRSGFEAQQGAQLDPRTFQYDRLTPAQKATYFKNIDDKAAFVKAHEAAAKLLGRGG